jgi:hypothetical protein
MKRRVLLNLWHALNKLEGMKHDVRFSYFLAKNKVALKTEIEALDEAQKPNAAFIEFENKRIDLAKKYSDKDATGNPKIHNGQYVIFDQKDEFDEEIKNLREKFKAAIESREAQVEEYNKMLKDEVDFKPTKIKFNQLPKQIESVFLEIFIEADVIDDDQDIN